MKIKGRVSRIFHRMDSGFKIIALEVTKNSAVPENTEIRIIRRAFPS